MPRGKWYIQDPRTAKWMEADEASNHTLEAGFQMQLGHVDISWQGVPHTADFNRRRLTGHGASKPLKREEVASSNPYEIDEYANQRLNMKDIDAFFQKHKNASDCEENCIQGEGLMSLCADLNISIDDESLLVLACNVQASEPFKIRGDEFTKGLRSLGIDTVKKLKAELPKWIHQLREPSYFRYFYWFVFDWTREENARVMQNEAAIESWQILLKPRAKAFPLQLWCEFISTQHKKAISKDVWKSLLDFMTTVSPDLSNYDEDEGWPVLMDEFVDWAKPRLQGK